MTTEGQFAETLRSVIDKNKHDRNLVEKLKATLLEHGIPRGETQRIINGVISFDDVDKRVLIIFAKTLSLYLSANGERSTNISPNNIFTSEEIDAALESKSLASIHMKETTVDIPIIIKKAKVDGEDSYRASVPISQIVHLYNSNVLEYNYDVNKQYKFVKNIEGKLMRTIDINLREVRKLSEGIINNTAKIGEITLNVLKGSNEEGREIEYDSTNYALKIFNSKIDIINGLHEINALSYVMEEFPENKFKVEVVIKNYNMEDIKEYFNKINVKGSVN